MITDSEPATRTFEGPSLVRDGEILSRGVPIAALVGTRGSVDVLFVPLQSRRPPMLSGPCSMPTSSRSASTGWPARQRIARASPRACGRRSPPAPSA